MIFHSLETGGTGKTWIIKPISLNRGNGIEVFNSLNDITAHISSKSKGEALDDCICLSVCLRGMSSW